jgi:hypothetical protein
LIARVDRFGAACRYWTGILTLDLGKIPETVRPRISQLRADYYDLLLMTGPVAVEAIKELAASLIVSKTTGEEKIGQKLWRLLSLVEQSILRRDLEFPHTKWNDLRAELRMIVGGIPERPEGRPPAVYKNAIIEDDGIRLCRGDGSWGEKHPLSGAPLRAVNELFLADHEGRDPDWDKADVSNPSDALGKAIRKVPDLKPFVDRPGKGGGGKHIRACNPYPASSAAR